MNNNKPFEYLGAFFDQFDPVYKCTHALFIPPKTLNGENCVNLLSPRALFWIVKNISRGKPSAIVNCVGDSQHKGVTAQPRTRPHYSDINTKIRIGHCDKFIKI